MKIEDIAGLSRLRHIVGRLDHDDERSRDQTVMILRHNATIMRLVCSTAALAFDAYRICAGLRFRRETAGSFALAA